jgi:hypothetical protein
MVLVCLKGLHEHVNHINALKISKTASERSAVLKGTKKNNKLEEKEEENEREREGKSSKTLTTQAEPQEQREWLEKTSSERRGFLSRWRRRMATAAAAVSCFNIPIPRNHPCPGSQIVHKWYILPLRHCAPTHLPNCLF